MQLGVIGLGTMGANLARNAARNGATVVVYNRTKNKTDAFMDEYESEGDFIACSSYEDLTEALKPPRAVLVMVKAGEAVDAVIRDLTHHLGHGDVIIDGGNSHYPDAERRSKELGEFGIKFIGMGVSGGEEGALMGPSFMPGGDRDAYESLRDLLSSMAADDGEGGKCVSFMGPAGAGHFVKMVHNGIEYGVMQLIAESYDILKNIGKYSNEDLAETFEAWNHGDDLQSFLIEISAKIFRETDGKKYVIDLIRDAAGQKGTGKWTTEAAMDLGVAIPTINAAVDARIISGSADLRKAWNAVPENLDTSEPIPQKEKLRSMVQSALDLSIVVTYMQGFDLIKRASDDFAWDIDLSECARIWRGGCIVRSVLLKSVQNFIAKDPMEILKGKLNGEEQLDWRNVIDLATSNGIPIPAMCASLSYFDALRRKKLPQNLIQAQRDFFGAHGFERVDKKGAVHWEWE